MYTRFLYLVVILQFFFTCPAQQTPSRAQIEQMKKQLQAMVNGKKFDRAALEKMKAEWGPKRAAPRDKSNLLAGVPKKPFNKEQLFTYLQNLEHTAAQTLPAIAQEAKSLLVGTSAEQAEAKAVLTWYNSAPETAIFMSLHTGVQYPDRLLNLNNLGAMLNLYGFQEKAVPILKTVLQYAPQNPLVLNNLGQAYAGLGAKDTALYYLGACMAVAPHHPEACTSAGKIEESRGNTKQAIEDYQNALKGAFSQDAADYLQKLDPKADLTKYVLPRFDLPYFNLYKLQFPPQNTSVDSTVSSEIAYGTFRNMLSNLTIDYERLGDEEGKKAIAQIKTLQKAVMNGNILIVENPFANLAGRMLAQVIVSTSNEWADVRRKADKLEYQLDTLRKNYFQRSKDLDGDCKAHDRLTNQYLHDAAELRMEWQKIQRRAERNKFFQSTYWLYMASINQAQAHSYYYSGVVDYLKLFDGLCQTQWEYPCGKPESGRGKDQRDSTEKAPDCPVNIEIPIVIGKIKLNCSQFIISGGEGLRLKYQKSFTTGESTMSIGAGLGLDLGKNFGGLDFSGSVKAQESFYISFDKENSFQDAGFSFEANASGSIDVKEEGIPKSINLASGEVKGNYTIGINSGWTISDPEVSGKTMFSKK